MKEQRDIFDDLLKSQLEGFMSEVSSSDWDAIESRLDAAENKRKVPFWWMWMAGLLAVGAFTVWYFTQQSTLDQDVAVTQPVEVTKDAGSGTSNEPVGARNNIPTQAPPKAEAKKSNQPGNETRTGNVTVTAENAVGTSQVRANNETKEPNGEKPSNDNTDSPEPTGDQELPTKNGVDDKSGDVSSKGGDTSDFTSKQNIDNPSNPADETSVADAEQGKTKNILNDDERTVKWDIGISVSPNLASKVIGDNGEFAWLINHKYKGIARSSETVGTSYQAGARINRHFQAKGQNFYIGTGFTYNQIAESVHYAYIVDEFVTVRETTKELLYTELHPLAVEKVNYTGLNVYHFIEIPVRLGFSKELLDNRMTLKTELGVKYMYLAGLEGYKTNVTTLALEDLKDVAGTYNRTNLGATANVGWYYKLGRRFELGLVPYYSYTLTSIRSKDAAITEKPYNFGINIGVQHNILSK